MTERTARRAVAALAVLCTATLLFSVLSRPSSPSSTLIPRTSDSGATSVPVDIDGVEWEIVSVDGRPVRDTLDAWFAISSQPPTDDPVATRPEDGNVFIASHDGCNTSRSRGQLSNGRLSLNGGGVTTAMYCPPPLAGLPIDSLLTARDGWLIVEGTVTLVAFDRMRGRPTSPQPVISEPSNPVLLEPVSTVAIGTDQPMPDGFDALAGTRWMLTTVDGQPWTSSLTPSFTIGRGVSFSGHDGCNRYAGNWWLDGSTMVVRSEQVAPLPCRAVVAPNLRPAVGFRFEFDGDVARSGPLQAGATMIDGVEVSSTTELPPPTSEAAPESDTPQPIESVADPIADPYVTFKQVSTGTEVIEPGQLVGAWRTVDGIDIEFTESQVLVSECGVVAEWLLTNQLSITRRPERFAQCPVVTESSSFAMLLLDSRSPERLEILDDGTLIVTSDTALTLLLPA